MFIYVLPAFQSLTPHKLTDGNVEWCSLISMCSCLKFWAGAGVVCLIVGCSFDVLRWWSGLCLSWCSRFRAGVWRVVVYCILYYILYIHYYYIIHILLYYILYYTYTYYIIYYILYIIIILYLILYSSLLLIFLLPLLFFPSSFSSLFWSILYPSFPLLFLLFYSSSPLPIYLPPILIQSIRVGISLRLFIFS